jgi:hypothetical protein
MQRSALRAAADPARSPRLAWDCARRAEMEVTHASCHRSSCPSSRRRRACR